DDVDALNLLATKAVERGVDQGRADTAPTEIRRDAEQPDLPAVIRPALAGDEAGGSPGHVGDQYPLFWIQARLFDPDCIKHITALAWKVAVVIKARVVITRRGNGPQHGNFCRGVWANEN